MADQREPRLLDEQFRELDASEDDRTPVNLRLYDRAGADMTEWPEDLRVREWPAGGGS